MNWRKYCFKSYDVDGDKQTPYPYWITDWNIIGFKKCYTIIAFFPSEENLLKYWDNVFDIDFIERDIEELTQREMINFADNGCFFSLNK